MINSTFSKKRHNVIFISNQSIFSIFSLISFKKNDLKHLYFFSLYTKKKIKLSNFFIFIILKNLNKSLINENYFIKCLTTDTKIYFSV